MSQIEASWITDLIDHDEIGIFLRSRAVFNNTVPFRLESCLFLELCSRRCSTMIYRRSKGGWVWVGDSGMIKKTVKQTWVAPRLEKIEMSQTQFGPMCGQNGQTTGSKDSAGAEQMGCSVGS